MILFGLCNCVTLWCAGWTIYLALPHTVAGWEDFPKLVETNKTLQELVISIAASVDLVLAVRVAELRHVGQRAA